ncbi:MFS transporter [Liquorilactobacillus uvarum]|uniref:MFS transporter n=1 Tax=Liquorilactobacillus uvarum TaxID=303240 RepID=UPI002889FCDE|nr:MFS transporter [Liquorilactobacillus uvarum]
MEEKVSKKTMLSIVAVALVSFSGIMAETAMNVTFPILSKDFHTNLNTIQWVTTAYLLAVTVMITTSAYLVKRYSSRRLWLSSIIIFMAGTLLGGLAPNVVLLLLGRILEGIAAGIAMPLVFNIVVVTVPYTKVGTWMGLAGMVVSLAPSFGPTYGGALVDTLGWRSIFFILLIAPIASLLLGWKTVGEIKRQPLNKSFDVVAFALLAVCLTTALLLVNQLESGAVNWTWFAIAFITLIAFIWRGVTSTHSFLNLKLFTKLKFVSLLIPIALYMFIMLGLNLIIPTYLQSFWHTSSFWAGFSLLPGTLLGAFLTPLFGRLYDLKGPKLPLYLGNTIFTIVVLIIAVWSRHLSLIPIIGLYIVFIIGRNMAYTSAQTAAIADEDELEKADATAIIQTLQMFMGALGTTVGALLQAQSGVANGFQNFSWFSFILAILMFGLIIGYFFKKTAVSNS